MNISSILSTNVKHSLKSTLNFVKNATLGVAISATPAATANSILYGVPKASIYSKSKQLLPNYFCDHPSFYVYEAAKQAVEMDINTGRFNNGLLTNKKSLMKDLRINNKTYDSYVELTKTIGQEERTIFDLGDPGCYSPYDISSSFSLWGEEGEYAVPSFLSKFTYVPINIERFNVQNPSLQESQLFARYGVNFADSTITPEKRAIGTIIHLSFLDKEYPQYLKSLDSIKPDFKDKSVQASMRNAERIMSDKVLAPFAVSELDAAANEISFLMGNIENINLRLLSKKDLDDLRIYASSIVLSKDAYMVERWDNHPVLPVGDKKDSACANILSLLLDKSE